ncbi:hypothetical protein [Sphingomonas humi]|uniref:Lipoprotein n=1 Tax=Sphingomonas humi TaxID=335630 RepID=A0ABP7SC57_9SPHN
MKAGGLLLLSAALLVTAGCSASDTGDDVPPLPNQTAETANALMAQAENAAADASIEAETRRAPARSGSATVNKDTP